MKNLGFVVAAGLLFCVSLAPASADGPVEEYRRACEAPHFAALSVKTHPGDRVPTDWEGPAASCRAFIQRLEADPEAGDESRLALLMAIDWLGESPTTEEARCAEIDRIASRLPNNPDALYEWSWCVVHDDDAYIALLKRLVEMGHPGARMDLVYMFEHAGDYLGIPPETLSLIATKVYEEADYVYPRYRAAHAIYKMAIDTGDMHAARAIQERLVNDHGLDALDYDPAHRDQSLERACDMWMFDMDLEGRLCVPALEALAAEALAHGEGIPDDVLRRMDEAFGESDAKAWFAGGGNDTGARLAAILAAHPEPLRSSEHLRVLAETAAPGSPERLAGLRKAVGTDPGNLRARCDLANALALTGGTEEAAALYKGLMGADTAPCSAGEALRMLADRREGEGVGEVEKIYLR